MDAGFSVVENGRSITLHDKLCNVYIGVDVDNLSEYGAFSANTMVFILTI